MSFETPVGRLSEGIDIIRMLWKAEGKISYEGEHFKLDDAVCGLFPYEGKEPEIWTAAHGPRMLRITGQKADGWLPTKVSPTEYGRMLGAIQEAGSAKGRDMDAFTPGMLGYVLVGPDEETVERLKEHPLVKMLCILLPSEVFRKLGYTPPLEGYGSGFHDFIPASVDREESMRIVDAIAPEVVDYYAFAGTVEQVAEEIQQFQAQGLQHLVLWNVTAFGDPNLAGWSFKAMQQLQGLLKR